MCIESIVGTSSLRTMTEHAEEKLSPKEQKEMVWNTVFARNNDSNIDHDDRLWPTYDRVVDDMMHADYNHTLTCPLDMLAADKEKTFCPHGVVACVKVDLFPFPDDQTPYTGLLKPNDTLDHCILRLSSAMKPPQQEVKSTWARTLLYATGEKLRNAQIFPSAALKVFRKGVHSGNVLFGGSKVGQRERDYFAHCQCTCMTEQMPQIVRPFVGKFWEYSDYPLSLGLSDFCQYTVEGDEVIEDICFPFALVLNPRVQQHSKAESSSLSSFDEFINHATRIPPGTTIFDIFACAEPRDVHYPSKLQRIGMITTTSPMISSSPNDGIFFRHQRKEDDYERRPEWKDALSEKVVQGKITGTIGQLAGWKLFEESIATGQYQDFELLGRNARNDTTQS